MDVLKRQWRDASVTALRSGTKLVFKPQKDIAEKIISSFSVKVLVTLCAPPQWGKTGVSLFTAYKMCSGKKGINPENVFFITAMSDRSWIEQTRERMLPMWEKNIFHRNTLEKFKKRVEGQRKENILIIIDECHLANSIDHTLGRVFEELGFKDPLDLVKNNIKILQISATPSNSLVDASEWEDHHERLCPKVDRGYVSFDHFLEEERVFTPYLLSNIDETEKYIEQVSQGRPMYHFVRSVCSGMTGSMVYLETQVNFEIICSEKKYELIEMNMGMERKDVKKVYQNLSKRPETHTFILIKNMLGASKTLDDTFIGSIHESTPMKKDYSSEVQGLPGRLCGWTKRKGNGGPKIFCERSILESYLELYRSTFYPEEGLVWRDKRMNVNASGIVRSKESYLNLG